ncbi:DUF6131 family protein [Streptomyces fuscichromogenes]|uniref:DUF6131 family protein n=1 Tax=Streptomyces fuscichromogenes TaxID=1324013 RepID=UPI0037F35262
MWRRHTAHRLHLAGHREPRPASRGRRERNGFLWTIGIILLVIGLVLLLLGSAGHAVAGRRHYW